MWQWLRRWWSWGLTMRRLLLINGFTPLHSAAGHGHVEVVTTLVELGADIGALTEDGETPLQISIDCGHHHVARVLRALERSARTKKEAEAKKPT
jgi:hypothetical protein